MEKLHAPLYDAFWVSMETLGQAIGRNGDPSVMRFFVDVQYKTRWKPIFRRLPRCLAIIASRYGGCGSSYPLVEQAHGAAVDSSMIIGQLIYSSVTRLVVDEKVMIEAPTFYFPGGAGVATSDSPFNGHGAPDPMATFRFAEPVIIGTQEDFRVEIAFPREVPTMLHDLPGPLHIWVILDGCLIREGE